jgi:Pretoxin HINT domain
VGDRIATESGAWVAVEGVEHTGVWAPVYNIRVADYHTYFVGTEEWGFSVWAHNEYSGNRSVESTERSLLELGVAPGAAKALAQMGAREGVDGNLWSMDLRARMKGLNEADVNHEAWLALQESHSSMAQHYPLRYHTDSPYSVWGPRPEGSLREQYLGRTPDKDSRTGREVQQRMRDEKTLRDLPDGKKEILYEGKWYPLDDHVDMAHSQLDAVTYWNAIGRKYGPKSPEVRAWMLDSSKYTLMPSGPNRSAGALLGEHYLPPVVAHERTFR